MLFDPDTDIIEKTCKSLIGCKINIGFTITLNNGETMSGEVDNCNIVGDCMEDILFPFIHKHIDTFEPGPKQSSPDFYNANKQWEWELKCFSNAPGFDVSNFNSYISQLTTNLERKMYKTQYLIFKYEMKSGIIMITDFKLCKVWEIINYTGKYPISLQSKKDMWYNIRPCCFNDMVNDKTPAIFIIQLCKAITLTPNKLENKQKIIEDIITQYNLLHQSNMHLNIDSNTGGVAIFPNKSP